MLDTTTCSPHIPEPPASLAGLRHGDTFGRSGLRACLGEAGPAVANDSACISQARGPPEGNDTVCYPSRRHRAGALAAAFLLVALAGRSAQAAEARTRQTDSHETADTDGDGIGDHVELVLGMDPGQPDTLQRVFHDPTIAEGDEVQANRRIVPDMTDVHVGNVAGNRWVWRVDFTDTFEDSGANLLVYIDADNDPATGRQGGATGTDIRLNYISSGLATTVRNASVCARDRGLRGIAVGRSMYFSIDVNLNADAQGRSRFRMHCLCQMDVDRYDSDSTGFFDVTGPSVRDIPKRPAGVLSQALSSHALVRRPWIGWRDDLRTLDPIVLDPDSASVETGMKRFNRAFEPQTDNAAVAWKSPVTGAYHLSVLVQDSGEGRETVSTRVGRREVATFVAAQNDGDLYLFTTQAPVELALGQEISFVASRPAQDFRLCEFVLTPRPPVPGPLRITNLETYCAPQPGDRVTVDVCFLTNYRCAATVHWGEGETLSREATEDRATYNHRVRLPGLARGGRHTVQARASDGEDTAESSAVPFMADARRPDHCSVARKRVELSVNSLLMLPRTPWPLNGGVPIPRGELTDARKCRILDARSRVFSAAQFTELSHWPDGSVKWLLVSLVKRQGGEPYTLEYGEEVALPSPPSDGIRIEESREGLRVITDRMQVDLSRQRFAPPGRVWFDYDGDGTFAAGDIVIPDGGDGVTLVDADGQVFVSAGAPVARLEVEESGPVRAVVLAEGPLTGPQGKRLSYRCRLTFYRGFPGIPIVLHLLADEGTSMFPPTMHRIKSLVLPVPLARAPRGPATRSVQADDDHYLSYQNGVETAHAGRLPGAIGTRAGNAWVTLAVRDFWQLFPKGLSQDGNRVAVEILPELPKDQYAEHTDPKLLTKNYYWFRDGTYLVPCGTSPSTDVLFHFAPAEAVNRPGEVSAAWQRPVLLASSPAHICASGAFMDLEPEQEGVFEAYQQFVRAGFDAVEARRRKERWYSWMNYGDWYGERGVNWGNQEYDTQWGLALQYARSGDMRFFESAESAARHTACIDQITWSPTPHELGIQKEHALGHTGGHGIPRVEGAKFWFADGIHNTGHMWTQGTYAVYCLTGDRRFKDAIDHLSNWMAGHYCTYLERWLHRNYGWAAIAVLGAYHTEPNPYYLNAARLFMKNVMSKLDPGTGAAIHPIGECTHTPKHMGGKTFMSGVVTTGLKMLDAIEPDDDLKQAVLNTCDWMYARMWDPDRNGFRYAQCPSFDDSAGSWNITMAGEGLAYAYELTKDPKYLQMLTRPLADLVGKQRAANSGKGYAMQVRMVPYALSAMDRWGMTQLPPLPPRPPTVRMADEIRFIPGGTTGLVLTADYTGTEPLEATVEVVEAPPGLEIEPRTIDWPMAPGRTLSPPMRVSGKAAAGGRLRLHWRAGQWSGEHTARLVPAENLTLGSRVGYVGGDADPVGLALQSQGVELPRLTDLEPATLAGYRALLVGSEAHQKGFAGLPRNATRLIDFARAGGRVVLIQIQDSSFSTSFLPHPLVVSDDKGSLMKVVARDHPIFTTPNDVAAFVQGLVSYDTLGQADPAWTVLATDNRGNPSIVESHVGKGGVLLLQPSPDRYVLGHERPDGIVTVDACRKLLENVVHYLQAGK